MEQRESVRNINGHSGQTTKDYYLKENRKQDVVNTTGIMTMQNKPGVPDSSEQNDNENFTFDQDFTPVALPMHGDENWRVSFEPRDPVVFDLKQFGAKSVQHSSLPFRDEVVTQTTVKTINLDEGVIGSKHPEKNLNARKAQWTDEEIDTVGEWCIKTLKTNPSLEPCIISKCNSYIMKTKAVREIFHPLHIASSARLRYGYDRYRMKHNIPFGAAANALYEMP